jgi:[ribosomal protein S5]-alanine N-acetyltransferase
VSVEQVMSARLRCERLRRDDAPELNMLLRDPRVARTTWAAPGGPSESEVAAWLAGALEHWRWHHFGLWLLRDRSGGEMVGRGGLQHTELEGRDHVEIAWAIVPERWGEGLATELATAAVGVAFNALALDQLVVLTLPGNGASRRVAEKVGFRQEGEVEHSGLPHVLYRLGR